MTVQSDRPSLLELSAISNDIFKERLQTIPGRERNPHLGREEATP